MINAVLMVKLLSTSCSRLDSNIEGSLKLLLYRVGQYKILSWDFKRTISNKSTSQITYIQDGCQRQVMLKYKAQFWMSQFYRYWAKIRCDGSWHWKPAHISFTNRSLFKMFLSSNWSQLCWQRFLWTAQI